MDYVSLIVIKHHIYFKEATIDYLVFIFQNQNIIVLKTFRCEIRTQFPLTIISYPVVQLTLKLYLMHFSNYFCWIYFDPLAQISTLMVIKGCFMCKSFHHTKLDNIAVQLLVSLNCNTTESIFIFDLNLTKKSYVYDAIDFTYIFHLQIPI